MVKEDVKMTDADAAPDGKAGDDLQQAKKAKLKGKDKVEDKEAELSEEDQELKANLELMVERSRDADPGIAANALEVLASAPCPPPTQAPAQAGPVRHQRLVPLRVTVKRGREQGEMGRTRNPGCLFAASWTAGHQHDRPATNLHSHISPSACNTWTFALHWFMASLYGALIPYGHCMPDEQLTTIRCCTAHHDLAFACHPGLAPTSSASCTHGTWRRLCGQRSRRRRLP